MIRPANAARRHAFVSAFWGGVILICGLPQGSESRLRAEVVRLIVSERVPFAAGQSFGPRGAYERIVGRLELEVDPNAPSNAAVVDLKRAARNERGKVPFSTDFCLLKPVDLSHGNRRLLYEVNNRGNKLLLGAFNDRGGNDPTTVADAGNGFLMREGYSILWCGWNGDVAAGKDKLMVRLPIATNQGEPIVGPIYAEICVDERTFSQPFFWGGSDPYPAVEADSKMGAASARPRLTKRRTRHDPPIEIPRDRWSFARLVDGKVVPDPKHLYLADGFDPGWLYDLVYWSKDPRVTGLGLAAVRDVVSFFRYARSDRRGTPNPLAIGGRPAGIERAYGFGISQSARFLHHFLFEGFNQDEKDRVVFDGLFAHVGGGGRGLFTARFAQTTRHGSPHEDNLYPSDVFPFTSTPTTDPVTSERGEILQRARKSGHVPKIFFTETSTEYWCRAASLLHTTVDGTADVPLDPHVRLYFIAGGQHGVSASTDRGIYQNPRNILDYRPVLRALLVALDNWVGSGMEPPPSAYPRLCDRTLVRVEKFRALFPKIPHVNLPKAAYSPLRLDLGPRWKTERIAELVPPRIVGAYCTLVPAVDRDGNETAGVRLPDVDVPVAAFTGWNLRSAKGGALGELARLTGSFLPFPQTAAERARAGDPRRSILERYPTRAAYVAKVRASADRMRSTGFLLEQDVKAIVDKAERRRDWPNDAK